MRATPTGVIRDRRAGHTRGETRLLERDRELAAIDELLGAGPDVRHRALLISGPPGLGKTRLCGVAVDRARSRGQLVLRAAGSELEREVGFGVAGQLLRECVRAMSAEDPGDPPADWPTGVRQLVGGAAAGGALEPEAGLAGAHKVFLLLATAAESRELLVVIDDLQWCDRATLEFVQYLLHRLAELPASLLLASRPAGAGHEMLDAISLHPAVRELRLAPLGREAVASLLSEELGDRDFGSLTDRCMAATGGNPFYLHELLLVLAENTEASPEQLEQRARSLAPATVSRSLRVRVGRLGADAGSLARAVAVLGDDVPLRTAASLAGLDLDRASHAADALGAADILMPREPLKFVHPLIRTAIEQDIPPSQLAGRHLEAARLLEREGEGADRVAAHLLRGRPEADPWAVAQLRAAATEAGSRGAAPSAVRYLERALAEPPPPQLRAELLAELGSAEAALGLAGADEHLTRAAQSTDDPRVRAQVAFARGGALYARGLPGPAGEAYQTGLQQLDGLSLDAEARELRERLQTALVLSMATVPGLQSEARRRSAEVMRTPPESSPTQSERLLLAQATVEAAFGGRPAGMVIRLATRAWDGGRLAEHATPFGASWTLVTAALCLAGDLERSLAVAETAAASARRRSAPLAFATATYMRALPQLWQGNVDGALADLELALDARRYGWLQYARSAAAQYCLCLIEKNDLDRAESVLTEDAPLEPPYDGEDAVRLYALGELRRAQGRMQEAYEVALAAGQAAESAIPYLGYCPWRASAAQSALAMENRDRAGALIQDELGRLQTTQVVHERIRALRLAGVCEAGERGVARLREAAALGAAHPPRLETVYALVALGSALRRANQRAEARGPLQRAFELARQGGASAVRELARTELAATGARLRPAGLSGAQSLTPSELRIARLAANGQSNREIAAALFITPKTVEYHLRNCYRKLDIQTRRQLADALEP